MRIAKIALDKFCGIESLTVDFDGRSADVFADSGAGKTALANAYSWLLCGCAMDESSKFCPYTFGKEAYWGRVDITFIMDNGTRMTLGKSCYQKSFWDKLRMAAKVGESFFYFLDGEKIPKATFESLVREVTGCSKEELLNMVVAEHIWHMTSTDRRKIVLEMFPAVADEEVVRKDSKTEAFTEMLHSRGIDAVAWNHLAKQRKLALKHEHRKTRKFIKGLLSELPNFQTESEEDILEEIQKYRSDIEEATKLMQKCETADIVKRLDTEIRSLRVKVGKKEKAYCGQAVKINKQKDSIVQEKAAEESRIAVDIELSKQRIADLAQTLKRLKEQEAERKEIIQVRRETEQECNRYGKLNARIQKIQEEILNLKHSYVPVPDFSQTLEFAVLKGKIDDCLKARELAIANEKETLAEFIELQKELIEGANVRLEELRKGTEKLELIAQMADYHARCIAELESIEYMEEFSWYYFFAKGELMNDRVSAMFSRLRFSFFEALQSGYVVEDCSPQVLDGDLQYIPFEIADKTALQEAKLEMAVALRKHYGKNIPIILDDSVCVDPSVAADIQLIRMIHSEDKEIRIEYRKESEDGTK